MAEASRADLRGDAGSFPHASRSQAAPARSPATRQHALALAAYALITIAMLYPLSWHATTWLPDPGDSLHNIWTYGDNINRLSDPDRGPFDANIFYPERGTAVFAELQPIHTVLFYPFFKWLHAPVAGFNVLLLLAFVLSAFFVYLIAFELTDHALASFVAGVVFGFFSFRSAHLSHVQILAFQWVLAPFYFLLVYLRRGRPGWLAALFACFAAQIASIGYNTVYLLLLAPGYLLFIALYRLRRGSRLDRRHLYAAAAMTAALALAIPVYRVYRQASRQGYARTIDELSWYGLDLMLTATAVEGNRLYGPLTASARSFRPDGGISSVFAGISFLVMALLSGIWLLRGWRRRPQDQQSVVFFGLVALGFWLLMLGPTIKFRGVELCPSPLHPLFAHVSVFHALRYMPNYVHPLMFALSVLIALGWSFRDAQSPSRRIRTALTALAALFLLENASRAHPGQPTSPGAQLPAVYQWLSRQERGAVAELPMPAEVTGSDPVWFDQFAYMYYSLYHRQWLVNGVTGFFPESFRRGIQIARTFPSYGSLRWLSRIGVRYVIVHPSRMQGDWRPVQLERFTGIREAFRSPEGDLAYELRGIVSLRSGPTSAELEYPGEALRHELVDASLPRIVRRATRFSASVTAINRGSVVWEADTPDAAPPGKGEVRLAIREWVRTDGFIPLSREEPGVPLHGRGRLPHDVYEGERVAVRMEAQAPDEPGTYQVHVNLVDELVTWFPQPDLVVQVAVE